MDIKKIIGAISKDKINITSHARIEAREDNLSLNEIYHATQNGGIIEHYENDTPYPSCLIYGRNAAGEPLHCVWAFDDSSGIAVLITVYRPDPDRWTDWKERKKR